MQPLTIVPNFDKIEDSRSCFSSSSKWGYGTLSFQRCVETFHGGIVITITGTAHADLASGLLQQLQVGFAGILAAPIAVME